MKVCSVCGDRYPKGIDFCFREGAVLQFVEQERHDYLDAPSLPEGLTGDKTGRKFSPSHTMESRNHVDENGEVGSPAQDSDGSVTSVYGDTEVGGSGDESGEVESLSKEDAATATEEADSLGDETSEGAWFGETVESTATVPDPVPVVANVEAADDDDDEFSAFQSQAFPRNKVAIIGSIGLLCVGMGWWLLSGPSTVDPSLEGEVVIAAVLTDQENTNQLEAAPSEAPQVEPSSVEEPAEVEELAKASGSEPIEGTTKARAEEDAEATKNTEVVDAAQDAEVKAKAPRVEKEQVAAVTDKKDVVLNLGEELKQTEAKSVEDSPWGSTNAATAKEDKLAQKASSVTKAPPKPSLGSLEIRSNPTGARVELATGDAGVTPYTASLPVGTQRIQVSKTGFIDQTVDLVIKSDVNSVEVVELIPAATARSGPVMIFFADRAQDTLRVDGEVKGTLPLRLTLTQGSHEFTVDGDLGKVTQIVEVKLKDTGTTILHLN